MGKAQHIDNMVGTTTINLQQIVQEIKIGINFFDMGLCRWSPKLRHNTH